MAAAVVTTADTITPTLTAASVTITVTTGIVLAAIAIAGQLWSQSLRLGILRLLVVRIPDPELRILRIRNAGLPIELRNPDLRIVCE
jgi:hypothetical protein